MTSFNFGDLLSNLSSSVEMLDVLIANSKDHDERIFKEVREGVNRSRRKLVYQLNNTSSYSEPFVIYSSKQNQELFEAMLKKQKLRKIDGDKEDEGDEGDSG